MTTPSPLIPGWVWRKILVFLQREQSGQIVLNVERGKIRKGEVREVFTESDD